MPWFAWLYIVVMVACLVVIAWCAWDTLRIAKEIRRYRDGGR